ncbi:MAG: hypothetical protein RR191_01380 [Cetobacterium sp.]|uniref:hypothetical protein n=1 Tax=Cetobacterium sp. TaxID=2071632 RepID=UPI002FC807E3
MHLNKNDIDILKTFLEQKILTSEEISTFLNLTSSQVKNGLQKIDLFLLTNNLGFISKHKASLSLTITSKEFNPELIFATFNLSAKCRQTYILLTLMVEKKIDSTNLINSLNITKLTLSAGVTRFIVKSYNMLN